VIRAASQKQNGQDLGSYKATLRNLLGLLKDLTVGERGFNIVTVVDGKSWVKTANGKE